MISDITNSILTSLRSKGKYYFRNQLLDRVINSINKPLDIEKNSVKENAIQKAIGAQTTL